MNERGQDSPSETHKAGSRVGVSTSGGKALSGDATTTYRSLGMRSGLRIKGDRGHPVVRRAVVRYAVWLREQFEFPIRVPAYLLPGEYVRTVHGDLVSASFFAPWDRMVEPYIRVATGDYPAMRTRRSRDDTLAAFLCSLSHEVIHYRQWVETGTTWERGVARRAGALVDMYALTTDRP